MENWIGEKSMERLEGITRGKQATCNIYWVSYMKWISIVRAGIDQVLGIHDEWKQHNVPWSTFTPLMTNNHHKADRSEHVTGSRSCVFNLILEAVLYFWESKRVRSIRSHLLSLMSYRIHIFTLNTFHILIFLNTPLTWSIYIIHAQLVTNEPNSWSSKGFCQQMC